MALAGNLEDMKDSREDGGPTESRIVERAKSECILRTF